MKRWPRLKLRKRKKRRNHEKGGFTSMKGKVSDIKFKVKDVHIILLGLVQLFHANFK